jgi:hypothetical protein
MTLLETMVAIPLMAILLTASYVSVSRYMSYRMLLGWSDVIVNDVRAAQQLGMAQRASTTVVTFTPQGGSTKASYATVVGGRNVRNQSLPLELDVTSQTITFNSLGVLSGASAVTVTLTDSKVGASRTLTVQPVTGVVTMQ